MEQAEIRVQLDAISHNVQELKGRTTADVMAVVKGDGYGHGMVPAARAAIAGGATWLGACTLDEAMTLRAAGFTGPVLAWLLAPGLQLQDGVASDVDLSTGTRGGLTEIIAAAKAVGRPARVHLKIDTGLTRGGSARDDWPDLVDDAAKAAADGTITVVGIWSHFANADVLGHPANASQRAAFAEALDVAERHGVTPQFRHLANSAATLSRADSHFDLVRPGIAIYGLSPFGPGGERFGLVPAMSVRATVLLAKRVPAGQGISYGHTYRTGQRTTVAVVPLGYADGIMRSASNRGPVSLGGRLRRIAGRVCMDQIVVDCGDDAVTAGDVAVLIGSGRGEPTADDWAEACGTINYEIVTRMGSARIPRVYEGGGPEDPPGRGRVSP
ncbi:MAG: alanine racemase [Micromonosporaceae bacterium]|nr:alanine racemase [Micromonosporaceae bacterium]